SCSFSERYLVEGALLTRDDGDLRLVAVLHSVSCIILSCLRDGRTRGGRWERVPLPPAARRILPSGVDWPVAKFAFYRPLLTQPAPVVASSRRLPRYLSLCASSRRASRRLVDASGRSGAHQDLRRCSEASVLCRAPPPPAAAPRRAPPPRRPAPARAPAAPRPPQALPASSPLSEFLHKFGITRRRSARLDVLFRRRIIADLLVAPVMRCDCCAARSSAVAAAAAAAPPTPPPPPPPPPPRCKSRSCCCPRCRAALMRSPFVVGATERSLHCTLARAGEGMELQVLLSDMARIMELPPHSSFGDAQDTPPSPPQHHPPLQHQHQQHQSQQHQPQHQGTSLPLAQHLQLHAQHQAQQVQSSMLALLGTAAAAAAAHPDGAAHPGHTGAAAALAVWPGASPSQRPQLSPASGGSDAGDVLAGAADDSASDLFWSHGASSSSPPRDGGGSRLPPRASPRPAAAAARPAPRRPRRPRAARTEAALSKEGARRPESAAWEAVRGGALPRRHPPRPRPRARHHRRRPGRPPLDGEAAAAARRRRQEGAQGRSEALLALPSLTVFKQEAPSPSNGDNGRDEGDGGGASGGAGMASQLQQLLQQHAAAAAAAAAAGAAARGGGGGAGAIFHPAAAAAMHGAGLDAHAGMVNSGECFSQHMGASATNSPASSNSCPSAGNQEPGVDCRFQYVLAAATSIATKVNEETLTYLNQGQSYEIKLKKLGELSAYRGKILKSTIRVCFHERRLQYTEREQMAAWQASRPGDRVVEVDVPLSYGLLDIIQDPMQLNAVEFLWDPTKEVGVYIKVNCISTEFTPKKHGGEKGVPFRIQVETYLQGDGGLKRLHAAACQVKVFKLKGADRKHKQDREKILKRPLSEQEKYQPSYECTVLSDIPSDALMLPQPVTPVVTSSISTGPVYSPTDAVYRKRDRIIVLNILIMKHHDLCIRSLDVERKIIGNGNGENKLNELIFHFVYDRSTKLTIKSQHQLLCSSGSSSCMCLNCFSRRILSLHSA
ncbi:Uncharacterized protein, isoform D, partial [Gryllus bimaculatus]